MTDLEVDGVNPSPATLARSAGVEPSDGPAGDASIDHALEGLASAVSAFDAPTPPAHESEDGTAVSGEVLPDATDVLVAGRELHDVLQRRLDEAAG